MTDPRQRRFSPEVRQRAVRLVQQRQGDHASQWAAISSVAAKIGCTGETLRGWLRQSERGSGKRAGTTSDDRDHIKALERENRELRQANEILRKASAYFAQAELDRRFISTITWVSRRRADLRGFADRAIYLSRGRGTAGGPG